MRSDYVSNAFSGQLIGRIDCLRLANQTAGSTRVDDTSLWLIHAARVADWCTVPVVGAPAPTGKGYCYEFVPPQGVAFPSDDLWRQLQPYGDHIVCQITTDAIRWPVNGGASPVRPRPTVRTRVLWHDNAMTL